MIPKETIDTLEILGKSFHNIDIPGFQIQKIETYVVLKPTKKEI